VRELSDFEARELAATENLQRDDLHPIEEAEAYEGLLLKPVNGGEFKPPRTQGYSVDELAARIGKSRGYVFGRLKLLSLIPEAREAFFEDKLTASVALMVARMPAQQQEKALPELLRGWAGEPFSARQATENLHRNYMLALKGAVFNIADADLVATAGSCHTCPKRTGASPDLFEDVTSADTCTDPACFNAKVKAHGEKQISLAREKGLQVVTGKAVAKIMPYGEYSLAQTGHLNLDKPAEELTGSRKTLRTLLGDDFKEVIVIKGEHQEQPMRVAQHDAVKTALKAKGLLQQSTKSKPGKPGKALTVDELKKQRSKRVRELMFKRAPSHLWKHLVNSGAEGLSSRALIRVIEILADHLYYDLELEHILEVAGLHKRGTGRLSDSEAVKLLEGQPDATLANIVFMCLMGDHLGNDSNEKGLREFAADLEWPVQALVDEISGEVDSAIADEIDALKAAVKPAAKKKTAATKTPTPSPKSGSAKKGEGGEPQTPETALAAALAKEKASAPKGAKKTTKSTSQKDKAAAPQVSPVGAWPFPTGAAA
jgi:ParB-like chromosome segregation protein Spo0J